MSLRAVSLSAALRTTAARRVSAALRASAARRASAALRATTARCGVSAARHAAAAARRGSPMRTTAARRAAAAARRGPPSEDRSRRERDGRGATVVPVAEHGQRGYAVLPHAAAAPPAGACRAKGAASRHC